MSRAQLSAQFQMPDPKQMSGIPRPVDDLPDATVSVRIIRGQMTNNLVGQPVTLEGGGKTATVSSDDGGRSEFTGFTPGAMVKASADVDGEHLESEEFPFPGKGGIRLLLVATDKAAASAPAVTGDVSLGGQSRIVIEPGDETVSLYYLLTIVNSGSAPVNPPKAFTFDMPTGAVGTAVLQGSSPQATAIGTHIVVKGPFAPGSTTFQVGCELPVTSDSLDITTKLPATLEQLAVVVKKLGNTKLSSASLSNQQEMPNEGETYILASGGSIPADRAFHLTLSGLPHHSNTPRIVALMMAFSIVLIGAWVGTRPSGVDAGARGQERKRLVARREKLLGELVRLETDSRAGRVDPERYETRREQLISMLELVYGALDQPSPDEPLDGLRLGRPGPTSANA